MAEKDPHVRKLNFVRVGDMRTSRRNDGVEERFVPDSKRVPFESRADIRYRFGGNNGDI